MANVASTRTPQVIRFFFDSDFSGGAALTYQVLTKAEIVNVQWIRGDAVGGGQVTLANNGPTVSVIGSPANINDSVWAANLNNTAVLANGVLTVTASLNTIRGELYVTILPGV
jgi:hypothetical protein